MALDFSQQFQQDLDDTAELFVQPCSIPSASDICVTTSLQRCTSTPLNQNAWPPKILEKNTEISTGLVFDSGFESDLSTSSRATPIITRSRSRQWSGPASTQLKSDIRQYPKEENGGQKRKNRSIIVYRPGLFDQMTHLDIIKKLSNRNAKHILCTIWAYLSPKDLAQARQVSMSWNISILLDLDAMERFSQAKAQALEQNSKILDGHVCSRLLKNWPRKAFGSVTNLLSPVKPLNQRRSPRLAGSPGGGGTKRNINEIPTQITSPSKFRHRLFAEVDTFFFLSV